MNPTPEQLARKEYYDHLKGLGFSDIRVMTGLPGDAKGTLNFQGTVDGEHWTPILMISPTGEHTCAAGFTLDGLL